MATNYYEPGHLTAKAFLKNRWGEDEEVNAVLELPASPPFLNLRIPCDKVPVSPGTYELVARYDNPEYGSIKDRKKVTFTEGTETKVKFNFNIPSKLPCPSCYRIHGSTHELVATKKKLIFFCNACGQTFEKKGNVLIPQIADTCEICNRPKQIRRSDTPGAHTNRVYFFVCPEHGPFDPLGLKKVELSEQDYMTWKEHRKVELDKKWKILRNDLYQKLAREYGVTWNPETKKFTGKVDIGKRTDFRNQLEDTHQILGESQANISRHGMVNISADRIRKNKLNEGLIKQDFITERGLSDKDIDRFSPEEQEEYKKSQEGIAHEAKGGRIEKEDKEEEEKREENIASSGLRRGVMDPLDRFSRKVGHKVRTVIFSLLILVVGLTIAAIVGNTWYIIAFAAWSLYTIFPNPEKNEMVEEYNHFKFGSFFATPENRTNIGLALVKAICYILIVMGFVFGLYSQPFPMSNLILLFLSFGFYFSMPVEFETDKPYEIILSFARVLLAIYIAIWIFGALGGGIFQSKELGWLTLAFFAVWPVATEKNSVPRALGLMGKGSGENNTMINTLIFVIIMILFARVYGLDVLGKTGLFAGTAGTVFLVIWIIGFISGISSPPETRPWMGIIVLIVGFVVFGMGAGQQAMGVAFFGEWWPTIHNTVTDVIKPLGDLFTQFQVTFGQSWLLFTNPVAYAQQITQGTYAHNELGVSGAYGLEIRKFDVQSIYIDEPFMIQIEIENKGIFHAKNVRVDLLTNIQGFCIGKDPNSINVNNGKCVLANEMTPLSKPDQYNKLWYKYMIGSQTPDYNFRDIEPNEVVPIFLYGKMDCATVKNLKGSDFGTNAGAFGGGTSKREYFIPFVVNVTYDYEATSNLQIDFISREEWLRLSKEGTLNRAPKSSLVSTSPASLNLGTMDQPIAENLPFFVGFNLTTTWPKNTLVTGGVINLNTSDDFIPYNNNQNLFCTKTSQVSSRKDGYTYTTFNLSNDQSKEAFCSFSGIKPLNGVPKKTYIVYADAVYTFSKWDSKDTQFNFKDVCLPREGAENANIVEPKNQPGGSEYCKYLRDTLGVVKCSLGYAQCQNKDECSQTELCYINSKNEHLDCRKSINVDSNSVNVCCFESMSTEQCKNSYKEFVNQMTTYGNVINPKKIEEAAGVSCEKTS